MDELRSPRIFLSYARADRSRVAKIVDALTAAGLSVWWDAAIEGGAEFSDDIARELDAADAVIVAWSTASIASAWVRDEADVARERKKLVPVLLDQTLPPLGFRQVQSIDLSSWGGRATDPNVVALIAAVLRVAGNAPAALPVSAQRPSSPRRALPWVGAALALIAVLFAGWRFLTPKVGHTGRPVIAVLPFKDAAGEKTTAYFAEGLAEEVLDTLSRDARLKVMGSNTARAIQANVANPDFARDKLGVTRLLEGSVRGGEGSAVKVSVRLIDTADGSEVWGQTFDRSGTDVAAMQGEVAHAVAAQLAGAGSGDATAAPAAKVLPAAYEKLVVARQLLRTRQSDLIQQAFALARDAVALAPSYAPAYAVKARATSLAVAYSGRQRGDLAEARRDAETAIRMDPNLPEGYKALGGLIGELGDPSGAIGPLARALSLAPDDAEARFSIGLAYLDSGNADQAIPKLQTAVAADPLWFVPARGLIRAYGVINKPKKALQVAQHFRAVSPNLAESDTIEATAEETGGNFARALLLNNEAILRNPKLVYAIGDKADLLLQIFESDRFDENAWSVLPSYYRPAVTGRWQQVAESILKNGTTLWDDPGQIAYVSSALVQTGRPAELVSAFDARFANVGAYVAAPAADEIGSLSLAAAFDRVGRAGDARALRDFARKRMTRAEANGTAPAVNAFSWATLLLAMGDRAGALTRLERGTAAAWWKVCGGPTWIGDVWVFAPLHGDPRFNAVKTRCRAEINRQRQLAGFPPAKLS